MMKCENCPFYVVEGVQNDTSWCKLYNAEAPVEGCEGERDSIIKNYELMQAFLQKEQQK